jgi:putative tryptophan/tyrosine transport system substrate-binding protein
MRRREIITGRVRRRALLAMAAATLGFSPAVSRAQQGGLRTIGVLVIGKPDPAPMLQIFRGQLEKLGYAEGRNVRILVRSAEGDTARLPALAAKLAHENVDVVATWMTPAVLAAKQATSRIPIVMLGAADPVGMGIVDSLARPGGNITGIAGLTAVLAGKIVELFKETLPGAERIAVLCNAPDPFSKPFREEIEAAGKANGIEAVPLIVNARAELDAAFPKMVDAKIPAVIVQPSLPLAHAAELALSNRIAAASPLSPFAGYGGLLSFSNDPQETYREAAVFVAKILKGASPADLPVEQPSKFELIINLKTAKAIGLVVPPAVLARASEVLE